MASLSVAIALLYESGMATIYLRILWNVPFPKSVVVILLLSTICCKRAVTCFLVCAYPILVVSRRKLVSSSSSLIFRCGWGQTLLLSTTQSIGECFAEHCRVQLRSGWTGLLLLSEHSTCLHSPTLCNNHELNQSHAWWVVAMMCLLWYTLIMEAVVAS